jgi:hypothetical protein
MLVATPFAYGTMPWRHSYRSICFPGVIYRTASRCGVDREIDEGFGQDPLETIEYKHRKLHDWIASISDWQMLRRRGSTNDDQADQVA